MEKATAITIIENAIDDSILENPDGSTVEYVDREALLTLLDLVR